MSSTSSRWGDPRWRIAMIAGAVVAVIVIAVIAVFVLREPTPASTGATPGPTASSDAPPAPVTPSATAPERAVTIAGTGDIIMGSIGGKLPANGGKNFFDKIKSEFRVDLMMGNLETPLSDNAGYKKCPPPSPPPPPSPGQPTPKPSPSGCFAFRLPPAYAGVLKNAGFHLLNIANNHTLDAGPQGLADTRKALEGVGLKYTGMPAQITLTEANGVKIAVLGFSPYSWTQSVIDVEAAAALVRQAATQAELVVVNMHAGAEGASMTRVKPGTETFLGENRGDPIKFARAVVDAGADLVVGHSPHVMRGMEFYKGRLIAYSMGNFAGGGMLSSAGNLGVGGIVRATLRPDGTWVGGKLVATQMDGAGLPVPDPARRAHQLINDVSRGDLPNSAVRIGPDGTITQPG